MPLTPVAKPAFADVPRSAGVPSIFRAANQLPVQNIILVAGDALSVMRMFAAPQWGVFTESGAPVAIADSVVSVDFRREWRVSDYPLERGAFESYDKVALPFDVRVRFAVSNSMDLPGLPNLGGIFGPQIGGKRGEFLDAIDAASKSLALFTVATPDATYPSVNIVHYDYRREARNGASLLSVDVWLEEIRVNAQAQFTDTAEPDGEAQKDDGAVQPVDRHDDAGTRNQAVSTPVDESGGLSNAPTEPPAGNMNEGADVTTAIGEPGSVTTTNFAGDTVQVPPLAPPTMQHGIIDQESYKFMVN